MSAKVLCRTKRENPRIQKLTQTITELLAEMRHRDRLAAMADERVGRLEDLLNFQEIPEDFGKLLSQNDIIDFLDNLIILAIASLHDRESLEREKAELIVNLDAARRELDRYYYEFGSLEDE